jgi:predicted acyl esterase
MDTTLWYRDMRGRYESEGKYLVSAANREDGYDTVGFVLNIIIGTARVQIMLLLGEALLFA